MTGRGISAGMGPCNTDTGLRWPHRFTIRAMYNTGTHLSRVARAIWILRFGGRTELRQ